jgi:AcrR family transcriptional regulator
MLTYVSQEGEMNEFQVAVTSPKRPRDAGATRALLLARALSRFTVDGYDTTTVRQIAEDAGVNVALISRYFGSKEGLFEACLEKAGEDLQTAGGDVTGVAQDAETRRAGDDDPWLPMASAISRRATARSGETQALLLLLRSSGDPAAERLRLATLGGFAEKLAAAAGWSPESGDDTLLLRAQVLLATAVGIAMLCAPDGLQPLASATLEEIVGPVGDVVRALLGAPAGIAS